MARSVVDTRPELLAGAFVLAALLHVLLFGLFALLPDRERASLIELPEREPDSMLRFSFADDPDPRPEAEDAPPRGDTPLAPTRQTVPPQPQISLRESPAGQEEAPPVPQPPGLAGTADQPTPSAAPTVQQEARRDEAADAERDTEDRPVDTPPEETSDGRDEAQPTERPSRDSADAPIRQGASPVPPPPARPRRSLADSLDRFERSLERGAAGAPSQGTNRTVFMPDPGDVPVQGAPHGVLEFSSRDYDWSDYARQIYERILKAWYRRLEATTNRFERWGRENSAYDVSDQARIFFTIQGNGDVTDIRVVTPSGCQPLDLSATDALEEVLLPPLPADFPRNSEEVKATFIMRAPVFELRDIFRYLRRQGYLD